jgi:hypothetical protein
LKTGALGEEGTTAVFQSVALLWPGCHGVFEGTQGATGCLARTAIRRSVEAEEKQATRGRARNMAFRETLAHNYRSDRNTTNHL